MDHLNKKFLDVFQTLNAISCSQSFGSIQVLFQALVAYDLIQHLVKKSKELSGLAWLGSQAETGTPFKHPQKWAGKCQKQFGARLRH